uniref:Uncharacterized protein n=1 Tax=Trichogramma kaykai TaxID=54128 RepID=A0ABD2X5V3_9HYME
MAYSSRLRGKIDAFNVRRTQDQMSPLGTADNQSRRPSRSPRNQRSRSADVDCLKKYMEKRVEVRRHTEAGEVSRWIPLSKRTSLPARENVINTLAKTKIVGGNDSAGNREGDKDFVTGGKSRRSIDIIFTLVLLHIVG